jgi:hypothetical protein
MQDPASRIDIEPDDVLALDVVPVLFNVIRQTFGLSLGLVAALLLFDGLGWRLVSAMFDRERLVTGARS